uniref:Ig-like domain-containing protein n=1 Tax=Neogobius melanostomus TaxID=47308 RepID=A0A8C6U748_9GOBI
KELYHRSRYAPLNATLTASPEQVLEGRVLTLTCQSDGAPPPTLILSRTGVELHREDHAHNLSFSLSSAQQQDSAHYVCESTNPYGAARDGLNVTVRAPPRNTSVLVLPSSVVFEGQNITVCCSSISALARRELPAGQRLCAGFRPLPGQRQQRAGLRDPRLLHQRQRYGLFILLIRLLLILLLLLLLQLLLLLPLLLLVE